jgi:hypothetical protein
MQSAGDNPPSNVHRFPREIEVRASMAKDAHARFAALLDELLELKKRLRAARRVIAAI